MTTMTEEQIVRSRQEIITGWYLQGFPPVAAYVKRHGGTLEEAKEVFQEAIVLYYEKIQFTDFQPQKADEAYLLGIAKNRWLKSCAIAIRHEQVDQIDVVDIEEETPITRKLLDYVKQSGERCMELLQTFYFEKMSMTQLAARFGYGSERSATVQKYKCLEKVRDIVKRKSLKYEDFLG